LFRRSGEWGGLGPQHSALFKIPCRCGRALSRLDIGLLLIVNQENCHEETDIVVGSSLLQPLLLSLCMPTNTASPHGMMKGDGKMGMMKDCMMDTDGMRAIVR